MDTILLTISFFINILLLLFVLSIKIELNNIKEKLEKLNKEKQDTSLDDDIKIITNNDNNDVIFIENENDDNIDENYQNEDNDSATIVNCDYYDDNKHEFNDVVAVNIDNTFKNVYEFIDYVSDHNLYIADIANRKVRKIKYLENCRCNNQETVFITFEDGKMAIFMPFLFAKYYHKEE